MDTIFPGPNILSYLHARGVTRLSIPVCDAVRRVLMKRRPIRVSEWAERHRVVTMSKLPGAWRNRVTPYLAGVMDAMGYPSVRKCILCKAPQVGGSECVNNFVGWAVDRSPGPVLYVYPDALTARENSKDRILPMIESSPRLRGYMTGWEDDKTSLRIKLVHMPIFLAWAGSPARLANKPIKYVIFDETDKYPDTASKREADPISLGEKRVITYRYDHKIILISTPTIETAPIWQALQTDAEAVFDYAARCPACGRFQVMNFEKGIRWAKDKDADGKDVHPTPARMESEFLAWYACESCGDRWDDARRDHAVRDGEWRDRDTGEALDRYLTVRRPARIGFHLPSWISPFVSMSRVAADFLRARHNKTLLKDWLNGHAAQPWKDYTVERKEDAILALRDERPRGLVPSGDLFLTAAVDTQDYGFWYEIRAWASGSLESWCIREGYLPCSSRQDFSLLDEVLFDNVYSDAEGDPQPIQMVIIDSGGHRTAEVYDWCRRPAPCRKIAVKGEQRMAAVYKWSKIDTYPGTSRLIPGGIQLLRISTTHYKNALASRLEIAPTDPGAWHYHSETNYEWAQQMCAEHLDDTTGLWTCPPNRDNHAWDCSVYNMAAADIALGPWAHRPPRTPPGPRPRPKQGGFIPSSKGKWLK